MWFFLKTYDLWVSQINKEIFSMISCHCEGLERELLRLGMPSTAGTDSQSLDNAVNVLVKHFGLEKKLSYSPVTDVQTWQNARLYLEI